MNGLSTTEVVVVFAIFSLVQIGFGYLTARAAVRKGYSLPLFWVLGTIFLVPTAIAIAFLSDRSSGAQR